MSPLSILENLNIIKDIMFSSSIYLILLIIGCMIILFISTTNKINVKFKRKIYILSYIGIFLTIGIIYYKDLANMLDYLMNNLFIIFYFPNLACYLTAIVVTNIILCTTTLNGKESRTVKIVNSTIFVIIHYLLILLLVVIKDNKLNVFSQKSIYSNEKALAIITLSSIIFITWIVFTVIYKLVRQIIYKRKGIELNQVVVYSNEETSKVESDSPIRSIEAPAFISIPYTPKPAITPTITAAEPVVIPLDRKPVYQKPNIVLEKPIEEKTKPQKSKELLAYEETLTLEDYKLLLSLLKAEKEKMKEQVRDVVIDDKEESNEKRQNNTVQSKLGELQDLYRSIS